MVFVAANYVGEQFDCMSFCYYNVIYDKIGAVWLGYMLLLEMLYYMLYMIYMFTIIGAVGLG